MKKHIKLFGSLTALICALCLVLGTASFALADDSVTLKFIAIGGSTKEAGYNAAIARWNELHPDAQVEAEYYTSPIYEVIEMALGIGSTDYDIISVDTPKVGDYGYKGYTLDLSSYVGSVIDTSVFQTPALNACYYEGQLTCLPMTAGISYLYYNKTLMEQAGVELREITPENRLTFEEMEEIALQVLNTVDPNRDQGYSGISFSQANMLYSMNQLPTSFGASALVDDQDLASTLRTDGWRNAALFYQRLIDEQVTNSCLEASIDGQRFMSGKCVFLLGSISYLDMMRNVENSEIMVTYNPVFADYNIAAAPTGSWCTGVSAFSKHPDLAAEFVWFLSAGEGHEIYKETANAFSALQTDADALLADSDADYAMQIGTYEVANVAMPRPVTRYFSTYETVVNEFWRNVAAGTDVDEAIETAIETYAIYIQ